jgi:hypothetical protein
MKSRIDELAEQLGALSLQIKHDMEAAEAKAERVNELVCELGSTGLLAGQILSGDIYGRPYDPGDERNDSGQVFQAVLLVPEGFGICVWDREDFAERRDSPEGLEPHARVVFRPFSACSPSEKKYLLPSLEELLEDLTDIALVAASKLEPQPRVGLDEYLASRRKNAS